jgi:hypothetical protein
VQLLGGDTAELQLRLKRSVPTSADVTGESDAVDIARLRELRAFAWGWNVLRVERGEAWLLM